MGWGLLLLLVLLPGQRGAVASTNPTDLLDPFVSSPNGSCDGVQCGRGKCQPYASVSLFRYSCECDPGWTKLGGGGLLGSLLPIFPCVIPNCTLSFSCTDDTPATAAPPLTSFSASAGTLGVNLRCNCRPGYANFLNNTALACVKECFIEATCADLGSTTPADTPPPPLLADHGNGAAVLSPAGLALILLISSLLLATRT
ncbi:unnamed protein product [Spirodela intermedia]|uniref:Uncharacterized protein n=1 Tax=Spirodela intermedia TaxID=51605 RepID=A0A7I8L423_SPIIN|nr:unnamed protein product [Spirodela intermedia]